jgi:hypothetical protein
MRTYRAYSDKDIVTNAVHVKSLAGLLRALKLKPAGGNYIHMKKHLQRLKVDCSHWTGQAWNKGEQLKNWKDYTKVGRLKIHLISKRGHKCELCNLSSWLNQPILLEVHHINGDRTNNKKSNLQLLCLNCHSCTPNFRGRKLSTTSVMR